MIKKLDPEEYNIPRIIRKLNEVIKAVNQMEEVVKRMQEAQSWWTTAKPPDYTPKDNEFH